jgi:hypothetical protein
LRAYQDSYYVQGVETNNHGEKNDAVSPSVNAQDVFPATKKFRNWILGTYKGELPRIDWCVDGNIFSILGTLKKGWRKKNAGVVERLSVLTEFAMSGNVPSVVGFSEAEAEQLRSEVEGYDELLAFCIGLSIAEYSDDLGGLEEDFPDDEDEDEDE